VVELCQGTNLRFKTVPAMADLIAGRASVKEIRDVDINDLLGRAPVSSTTTRSRLHPRPRRRRHRCRRLHRRGDVPAGRALHPQRLVLVEQAEPNLFPIDRELRNVAFADIDVRAVHRRHRDAAA
jgi:hypothetical protein